MSQGSPTGRVARTVTLVITFSAKITAIVIALNETLVEESIRPSAMAMAMIFFAGAEATERAVMRFIDRLSADIRGDEGRRGPAA